MSNSNIISESELLSNINNNIFDKSLVSKSVELNEDDRTHKWVIIRVNSDSYDLWYNDRIGKARRWSFNKEIDRLWINISTTGNTVRALCSDYKSKLSPDIQARLKPGLNVNCGDDLVVILSAIQLGYTDSYALNDDNTNIEYFNNDDSRMLYYQTKYWTSSAISTTLNRIWCVNSDGTFSGDYYDGYLAVVPVIRIGI